MESKTVSKGLLSGSVKPPSSKSDAQRALMCAGLSNGESIIKNAGQSEDVQAVISVLSQFGCEVIVFGDQELRITGTEDFPKNGTFNLGESGLGLRLFAALCASRNGTYVLTGEGTLKNRSHDFFQRELEKFGCKVSSNQSHLPITINGPIRGGKITIDGSQSSQYVSGLLIALPTLDNDSILNVIDLVSQPYVDLTLNTLKKFGIEIDNYNYTKFTIAGGQKFTGCEYHVETDWSAASIWLVAAALGHKIKVQNLEMKSAQADSAILEILKNAGCRLDVSGREILVDGSNLQAFNCDLTHCPDLFPALSCLALFCEGTSILKGISRLDNKESNRGKVLKTEFEKLGARIDLTGDEMHVHGNKELEPNRVDSHGDHRIAMCMAIAGTMIKGGVEVINPGVVSKSYPEFWRDLESLTTR